MINIQGLIFFIIFLITLGGCSKNNSSRTLNVASAFQMSSVSDGGFINVTGFGPNGKWFSLNANKGNPVSIILDNGVWTFHVVEWENGLASDTFCASSSVDLSDNDRDIYLSVSKAGCQNSAFSGNYSASSVANSSSGFLPLSIYSCGTLFEHNKTTNTKSMLSSSTPLNVLQASCTHHVPPDMRVTAKAVEIVIPGNLTPGGTVSAEISSGCVPLLSFPLADTSLRIPSNHIPVHIKLYENSDCSGMAIPYDFDRGLVSGSNSHHGVFNPGNTLKSVVMLPFTMSLFSVTPFYNVTQNLMPEISCGANACLSEPTIDTNIDFIIPDNNGSYYEPITISRNIGLSCSDVQISNLDGFDNALCDDQENEGVISVHLVPNRNCREDCQWVCNEEELDPFGVPTGNCVPGMEGEVCTPNLCSFDLSMNGAFPVTKYVTTYSPNKIYLLRELYQLLGASPQNPALKNSFENLSNTGASVGIVSNIRESLKPDGPVGMFGNILCANMSAEKIYSFVEEGNLIKGKVYVKDGSMVSIPSQIRSDGLTNFQKQVVIRESINDGPYLTKEVITFRCDKKIGMSESLWWGGDERLEQVLSYWNTESPGQSIVETYHQQTEKDEFNRITTRNRYEYLRKSALTKFDSITMNYESYPIDAESISESVYLKRIASATGGYSVSDQSFTLSKDRIQNLTLFSVHDPIAMKKSRLDFLASSQQYSAPWDYDEVTVSGVTRKAYIWRDSLGVLVLRYFNGSTWSSAMNLTSTQSDPFDGPLYIKVRINSSNGNLLVAYIYNDQGTYSVRSQLFNSDLSVLESEMIHDDVEVMSERIEAQYLPNGNVFISWSNFDGTDRQIMARGRDATWQTAFPIVESDVGNSIELFSDSIRSALLADGRVLFVYVSSYWDNVISGTVTTLNAKILDQSLSTTLANTTISNMPAGDTINNLTLNTFRKGNDTFLGFEVHGIGQYLGKITSTALSPSDSISVLNPTSPIVYSGHENFGNCLNLSSLEWTTDSCSNFDFESVPLSPIKNNVLNEKSVWYMNPTIFRNVFTPLETFKNLR